MFNKIIVFLLLLGTWLVLSGFFSDFFIGLGIFSCLLAMFVSARMGGANIVQGSMLGLVLRLPSYIFWIFREIVKSSIDVTVRMWQLEPEIEPEIAWVSTNIKSDLGLTVYGNSITLTPGTVAVDVRGEGVVQVHALTSDAMKDVRKGIMNDRVVKVIRVKE